MNGEDVLYITGPNLELSSIILAAAIVVFILFCIGVSIYMDSRKKKRKILKQFNAVNPFTPEDEAKELWSLPEEK